MVQLQIVTNLWRTNTYEGEVLGYTITNHFIGDKESRRSRACLKRNSYKDCVSQIVSDCEEAARRLPVTHTGDDKLSENLKLVELAD